MYPNNRQVCSRQKPSAVSRINCRNPQKAYEFKDLKFLKANLLRHREKGRASRIILLSKQDQSKKSWKKHGTGRLFAERSFGTTATLEAKQTAICLAPFRMKQPIAGFAMHGLRRIPMRGYLLRSVAGQRVTG